MHTSLQYILRYCTDLYDTAGYTKSKFARDTFEKEKATIERLGLIQSLADIHEKHTGDDMLKKRFCRVDGQSDRWSMLSALTEKA